MPISANAQGVVTGKFTVPANVPAGNKRVEFIGAGGSYGDAIFSGQGEMIHRTLQQQTTVTEVRWWSPPPPPPVPPRPAIRVVDPLAQTFSLQDSCQIGGIDLWFIEKGTSPVVVQLRETTVGFPNQTVLAEVRLPASDIVINGNHTRVQFPAPVAISGGQEYAIVALSDDAITSVGIAELGKWAANAGRWVTSQPYQVGVLLSSSNAVTWTPHQDKDLAFRILRANFTELTKNVALGSVAVANATDLMLLAFAERPSAAADVTYELALPGGETLKVSDGQPVRLAAPITGNVGITAKLSSTSQDAPVLHPGSQLIAGQVSATDDYVTRAIPAGASSRVRVIFDAIIPSGAAVAVSVSGIDGGDTYQAVPYLSAKAIDNGFQEITHELTGVNETSVRIKLVLSGTSVARPRVRNLRVIVT